MGFWFRYFFDKYQWYRKWHGGRWELWWVDICKSEQWYNLPPNKCYPNYRPPCCFGTPIIEDYPIKNTGNEL